MYVYVCVFFSIFPVCSCSVRRFADFWQQKHEQSIAHLLKQDSNTTTNGNAKLPFRVVSASDNSDLINFSSSSLHQETEIAAEERELDRALQSSAQISSLARFDSAVSLDNTDFSCSSNSSTADDIIHNNSGDPSVWPWSSDFSLPGEAFTYTDACMPAQPIYYLVAQS